MDQKLENTLEQTDTPKRRLLGFDVFRFFGTWVVFTGHIMLMVFSVFTCEGTDAFFNTSWSGRYYSPHIIESLWYVSIVPFFLIISGYFAFSKRPKPGDNEWKHALKRFYKYWMFTIKWLIVATVITFIYIRFTPGLHPYLTTLKGKPVVDWIVAFVTDSLSFLAGGGGLSILVSILYFVAALGFLQLLVPLFRPLFDTKNVRTIRYIVVVLMIVTFIGPSLNSIGQYILTQSPDSSLGVFLANILVLKTSYWEWPTFWIFYFLVGGLVAVDREFHRWMNNLSWKWVALIAILSLAWEGFNSKFLHIEADYTTVMTIPQVFSLLLVVWKLNFVIKEDSRVGKITNKYSQDMLAVMTIGNILVWLSIKDFWQPLHDLIGIFWKADNVGAGIITILWYFLLSFVMLLILTVFVHWFSKIPIIGNLMKL